MLLLHEGKESVENKKSGKKNIAEPGSSLVVTDRDQPRKAFKKSPCARLGLLVNKENRGSIRSGGKALTEHDMFSLNKEMQPCKAEPSTARCASPKT